MSTMYTQKILELIVSRPGIRTVEVADLVDCELEMVRPSIRDEIDAGLVKVSTVVAPNGRNANAFEPSPGLCAKYPHLKADGIAPSAPAAASVPDHLKKTKIDQVIDFIKAHGKASTMDLRLVLSTKAHPSAYLAPAMKDGRVVRNGEMWTLPGVHEKPSIPSAKPEAIATPAEPVDIPQFLQKQPSPGVDIDKVGRRTVVIEEIPSAEAQETVRQISQGACVSGYPEGGRTFREIVEEQANLQADREAIAEAFRDCVRDPAGEELEPQGFACALWSDGDLQLVRDGEVIDVLRKHEADILRRYLNRVSDEATA